MSSSVAVRHLDRYKIPPGLPELVRNFTREVLRTNPKDIYAFGADYFNNLLRLQTQGPFATPFFNLQKLFFELDADQSGNIPYFDFKNAVFDERVNLPSRVAQVFLLEGNINEIGCVAYKSVMELPTSLFVHASTSTPLSFPSNVPRIHIHGMQEDEFVATLTGKFEEYEVSSATSGIQRPLIRNALSEYELGLSNREINAAMGYIETQCTDGSILYQATATALYGVLAQLHEDNLLSFPVERAEAVVRLLELFRSGALGPEGEDTGVLNATTLRMLLLEANLGFTSLQVHALLGLIPNLASTFIASTSYSSSSSSSSSSSVSGSAITVEYVAYAEKIAQWVVDISNGRLLYRPAATIAGYDDVSFVSYVQDQFIKEDRTKSGYVPYEAFNTIMEKIAFTPLERNGVYSFVLKYTTSEASRSSSSSRISHRDDTPRSTENGIAYQELAQALFDVCWVQQRVGLNKLL